MEKHPSMNKVLETTKFVVDDSVNVTINQNKIAEFVKNFRHGNLLHWLSASPIPYLHLSDEDMLNFLLVFNSTSFCYWGNPKWTVQYKGKEYDGSWAMVATIMRAIDESKPILDSKYRASISKEDYQRILRGNVEIPLLNERWGITKAIASVLVEKYNGSFGEFVKNASGNAHELLEMTTNQLAAFEDITSYQGKTIYFYKRAQLLIEDIHQVFAGKKYGRLIGLDDFTACADYKLPQSLRKLGIFSYSKSLEEKIDNLIQLPHGSPEEVEIRANTIWAVEFIKQELQKTGEKVSSMSISDHLWLMGQKKSSDDKPYHRTLTTAY